MKTRIKKTDWKGQVAGLNKALADAVEANLRLQADHTVALGAREYAANEEKIRLTVALQAANEGNICADGTLNEAVRDLDLTRKEWYAKERELREVRREFESLVRKSRRSGDVSAVLAVFLLADNSEMEAVKKFIALADEMGLENVEEMHEPLQRAFRRAGEEVHKRAFAKGKSSGLASVMAKIISGGSLEIGDLAGLRQ